MLKQAIETPFYQAWLYLYFMPGFEVHETKLKMKYKNERLSHEKGNRKKWLGVSIQKYVGIIKFLSHFCKDVSVYVLIGVSVSGCL